MAVAYCVKCRTMRELNSTVPWTMTNGRKALIGFCATCRTKLFKIGDEVAEAWEAEVKQNLFDRHIEKVQDDPIWA